MTEPPREANNDERGPTVPIVKVRNERTVAALITRISKAGTSKAASARLEAAIKAANPGLDVKRLTRGDVVRVPGAPDLLKSVDQSTKPEAEDLFVRLAGLVEDWQAAAEATAGVVAEERAEFSRVVRDGAVKKAAAEEPDLAAALESLASQNREDASKAKAMAKRRAARVADMIGDLEALRARIR